MAAPRSVSPRAALSGERPSRAPRRNPRSVVNGQMDSPVPRNATSAQRSPSRESIRSATSAFTRSRRLGRTSSANIERETSIATTTLRERSTIFSSDFPHCGLAAAKRANASPAVIRYACRLQRSAPGGMSRLRSAGATSFLSERSRRARRKAHHSAINGTAPTRKSIHGQAKVICRAFLRRATARMRVP